MAVDDLPLREKVAVYLLDGRIIGGELTERKAAWLRLNGAFEIKEDRVTGPLGAIYHKGLPKGTVEIPLTSISHWVKLTALGLV